MPIVDAGKVPNKGAGWGCSCQSFKLGRLKAGEGLKALARAESVTVEFLYGNGDKLSFSCWTHPDSRYSVVYDPESPGGFCKHIAACLVHFAPWLRSLEVDAAEALVELGQLRREKKAWEKTKKG